MAAQQTLEEEFAVFERHKPDWVRSHLGEFVVIVGPTVVGFHADFESAFKAGLSAAGLGKSFLLKQVCAEEPVYLIY